MSETYYQKNKEKLLKRARDKYAADPERHRQRAKESKARNHEKVLERRRAYNIKNADKIAAYREANRIRLVVHSAIARAKEANLEYDSVDSLVEKLESADASLGCPCCGKQYGPSKSDSPTIDRVVPDRGYVVDNVCTICHTCNRQKQDLDLEKIDKIRAYIIRNSP